MLQYSIMYDDKMLMELCTESAVLEMTRFYSVN